MLLGLVFFSFSCWLDVRILGYPGILLFRFESDKAGIGWEPVWGGEFGLR